jgi:hypothetical protein
MHYEVLRSDFESNLPRMLALAVVVPMALG